jgi:hypothetical protein
VAVCGFSCLFWAKLLPSTMPLQCCSLTLGYCHFLFTLQLLYPLLKMPLPRGFLPTLL